MTRALLALAVVVVGPVALAAGPWRAPSSDVVAARVGVRDARPFAERLRHVSEPFVGAPYVLSPLGEGEGPDVDPRMRFDAFDCTTFVETVVALAWSSSLAESARHLDDVRYREGTPRFENRRHFPMAEWIPELVTLGYFEDVTRAIGGGDVVVAEKTLSHESWSKRRRKILRELPLDRVPEGTFALDVWPIAAAQKGAHRIPAGTVISVVRSDVKTAPERVTHQGLVVEKDGKLFLRHAADKVFHRVVDEPLPSFLARIGKYGKWPVTGVHLLRVRSPDEEKTAAHTR